jgi:hypothetical protein
MLERANDSFSERQRFGIDPKAPLALFKSTGRSTQ